jgi:hypothetical protein
VHVAENCHQLPNLLVTQDGFPSGHGCPANAVLQDVKILVLRHIGHVIDELRRRWIERVRERRFGMGRIAVT